MENLLHSKKDEREWVSIRDSENWELEQDQDGIMVALKLSYNDLPFDLKSFLDLCSMFPRDYEISNLIAFWNAQGLFQSLDQKMQQ